MNVISEILDTVLGLLRGEGLQEWGVWSYPLLTLLVILEGRIVTLLAAVAASLGYMRLPLVIVCAIVGGLVADGLWYLLGYRYGKEPVLRYGRWLGLRRHHLEQVQSEMQEHGPRLLFIAKAFSVLVIPVLVAAGMARVPFRRWFPIVLLGELLWVPALAVIGYQTTEVVRQVELGLHYLPVAGGAALLVLMLVAARRLKAGRAGAGWRLPVSWPDAYITYQTEVAPILNMYGSMAAVSLSQVVAPLRPEMAVARVSGRRVRRDPLFLGW
ncbi:MAG: DedA family protein [Caldilineaceae bacterium]|nr:DedA family protein [Caldilineaceae bacterium]MDE0465272.1 DedA family protein [Caldilineaceae bacterium]